MSDINFKRPLQIVILFLFGAICCSPLLAQSSVVVIPLFGDDPTPLKNIITVSPENGDFTDPVAAVASIPTAGPDAPSVGNPYLIAIGPGVYPLPSQLVMQPYVSVVGSGIKNTTLTGSVSHPSDNASSALVVAANQASLSQLSIINDSTGASGGTIGVFSQASGPTIKHLSIQVIAESSTAIGMYNGISGGNISQVLIDVTNSVGDAIGMQNNSSPIFANHLRIQARATGSKSFAIGIENNFSAIRMRDIRVQAISTGFEEAVGIKNFDDGGDFYNELFDAKIVVFAGVSSTATGILNDGASPFLSNIDIELPESGTSIGFYTTGTSSPRLTHCNIRATGSNNATGVEVDDAASHTSIEHCTISVERAPNSPNAILMGANGVDNSSLDINHSLFKGSGVFGDGDNDCVFTAADFGAFFVQTDSNCDFPDA